MSIDRDSLIRLCSYYRDAEMRGAFLLMKMMQRVDDPEAVVLFTRHIDDETRLAWMWTKRIRDEGGFPVPVPDGYQRRLGKRLGVPTSIIDLFALTVVAEERSYKRYTEHAASPYCDAKTLVILEAVTRDEEWHINWMDRAASRSLSRPTSRGATGAFRRISSTSSDSERSCAGSSHDLDRHG